MGHPSYTRDASDNDKAHISDSGWTAPTLGAALINDPCGQNDAFKTSVEKESPKPVLTLGEKFDEDLKKLFTHIQDRLKIGLSEAWIGKSGYDYQAGEAKDVKYDTLLDSTRFMDTPEEKWCRAFCEKFLFTAYAGVGQAYGYASKDKPILSMFETNDVVAIAVACQHLATYGILSRGIPLTDLSDGPLVGCGCTGGTVNYNAFDKVRARRKPSKVKPAPVFVSTKSDPKDKKAEEAAEKKKRDAALKPNQTAPVGWSTVEDLVKLPITPGSVVIWNGGGYENTTQDVDTGSTSLVSAHTAQVLRVSGQRIQFIDTGVVSGGTAGEGGTTDHSFSTGGIYSAETLVGVGVLRDTADKLEKYAEKTAKARVLGVTRLVVVRTASDEVVFVSKLLHMKWPVARLIWSLRNMPTKDVTVAWLVYVTGSESATDALIKEASAAPSTFLKTNVNLKLTNVLVSTGEKVEAYRVREYSSWRRNFSSEKISIAVTNDGKQIPNWAPEKPGQWKVDPGSKLRVLQWCADTKNFDSRLIRPKPGDKATINSEATGHSLVDP